MIYVYPTYPTTHTHARTHVRAVSDIGSGPFSEISVKVTVSCKSFTRMCVFGCVCGYVMFVCVCVCVCVCVGVCGCGVGVWVWVCCGYGCVMLVRV